MLSLAGVNRKLAAGPAVRNRSERVQLDSGVQASQILGISRDYWLAVEPSAQHDAGVHHVVGVAHPEKHTGRKSNILVEGDNPSFVRFQEPYEPHLPRTVAESLRDDAGRDVQDRLRMLHEPLEQSMHAGVFAL